MAKSDESLRFVVYGSNFNTFLAASAIIKYLYIDIIASSARLVTHCNAVMIMSHSLFFVLNF